MPVICPFGTSAPIQMLWYYNNTIIIEDLNGVYIWYGNVSTTSLKLYDYVEKGTYIGEAERNLYMVFSKDNKYLNYEEFLK